MKENGVLLPYRKAECVDCSLEERLILLKNENAQLRHDKAFLLWEKRRLRREIETDELTGLRKTRNFEKLCFAAMNRHLKKRATLLPNTMKERRGKKGYFVVFVDLDGLKMANDAPADLGGGHEAGDTLLRSLANTLSKRTRKCDVVIRCGGEADEFGVFLPGVTAEEATARMEVVRKHFEETATARCPVLSEYFVSKNLKISFSFGIQEIYPEYTEEEIRNVIARADALMYSHKERRKQDRRSMQEVASLRS